VSTSHFLLNVHNQNDNFTKEESKQEDTCDEKLTKLLAAVVVKVRDFCSGKPDKVLSIISAKTVTVSVTHL
jgi:hypothetical protein